MVSYFVLSGQEDECKIDMRDIIDPEFDSSENNIKQWYDVDDFFSPEYTANLMCFDFCKARTEKSLLFCNRLCFRILGHFVEIPIDELCERNKS